MGRCVILSIGYHKPVKFAVNEVLLNSSSSIIKFLIIPIVYDICVLLNHNVVIERFQFDINYPDLNILLKKVYSKYFQSKMMKSLNAKSKFIFIVLSYFICVSFVNSSKGRFILIYSIFNIRQLFRYNV